MEFYGNLLIKAADASVVKPLFLLSDVSGE
jgi:hypothetical protein